MKYEDTLLPVGIRHLYLHRLAELGISRRVAIVSELRESVKLLAREMIRRTAPHLSAQEVEREVQRRLAVHDSG